MKRTGIVATVVAACAVGWLGGHAFSGDEPSDAEKKKWEEMMKLAAPGEQHAGLAKLEGEWAVHGKFTFEPGKTTESDSTSSMKMILGGRFLTEEMHGDFQGMPFEGRNLIGYDNLKKQYFDVWIDNMGTGYMLSTGVETEPGKAWTFKGTMDMSDGPCAVRSELRLVSDKEFVSEMYGSSPQGETKMMELRYTRK